MKIGLLEKQQQKEWNKKRGCEIARTRNRQFACGAFLRALSKNVSKYI